MMVRNIWLTTFTKLLFLVILSLLLAATASAKITLSLDRTDIHEHETFHLRVQVEESNTLRQGAAENFIPNEITIRSRQEYNNSVIVNGQYNTQRGWDFELLAEKAGTYTIPALSIGNERSQPFTIRILPQQDDLSDTNNAKIKLRANISDEQVYVQQQLIFTVRIYRSVVARNQQITPIRVSNALVEQLGDNSSFDVVKDGNNFRVVEQRYAIFPQQSGEIVIEPLTYSATILEDSDSRSPWQRSQLKPVSLSTQKYTIAVKPKPQNAAEPWLPAKNLELEASWQPANQTFRVGEPANLDLIIKGTGLLKTQLPSLTFPEQEGITIYRDTPQYRQRFNRFGVNSYHFEKIAIIPSQTGDATIPEIKIPWWNVETDQQEYATLPAMSFRVNPSNKQISQGNQQTVIPDSQQVGNINDSELNSDQISTASQSTVQQDYWKYISLTLAALWFLTLLFWFKQRQGKSAHKITEVDGEATPPAVNSSLKNTISLATRNDAKASSTALLSWVEQQPSLQHIHNLNQLIEYCQQHQQSELAQELTALQQYLYAGQGASKAWRGNKLAALLPQLKAGSQTQEADGLPGLYD